MKGFRFFVVLVVSGLISTAVFFLIPMISALIVHPPKREYRVVPSATQVDISEPPKRHDEVKKEIRMIAQTTQSFKPVRSMGAASKGFHMDLSLATGGAGDGGVGVAGGGTGAGSGFGAGGGGGMGAEVYDPSEVDQEVRVLKEMQPTYPARARKDGVNGYVKFYLVIDARGIAADIQLLSVDPAGYGFEIEAEKALRQFRFAPAKLKDVPVAQKFTKEFVFDLGY